MTSEDWRKHQVELRESRFLVLDSRRQGCPPRIPKRRQMDALSARLWSFLALWLVAAIVVAAVVSVMWLV